MARLAGYAATYDRVALIAGTFFETIRKGAFDDAVAQDVTLVVNHDDNRLLARTSSGTLKLRADGKGLAVDAELPATTLGRDIEKLMARRDLSEMSFAFGDVTDSWEKAPDGYRLRTIEHVGQLWDVSIVTRPAYAGTSAALVSGEEFLAGRAAWRRQRMRAIDHQMRKEQWRRQEIAHHHAVRRSQLERLKRW